MVEYRQKNLNDLVFDGQDLTGSIFDRCNIRHCSFKNCVMDDVTIDRCNCIVCDWEGVDMSVINFINSNIITQEDEDRMQAIHHEEEPAEEEHAEETDENQPE